MQKGKIIKMFICVTNTRNTCITHDISCIMLIHKILCIVLKQMIKNNGRRKLLNEIKRKRGK